MNKARRFAMSQRAHSLFAIFITKLLFISFIGGGIQQEITEEMAVNLIRNHEMFDLPWTLTIYTREMHASIEDIERSQPYYSALKKAGLIDLSNPTEETSDGKKITRTDRTVISLTEKGRQLSKQWKQPKENEWVIIAAPRKFVEFLRFHRDREDIASVEFYWTNEPNEIGEALGLKFRNEKAIAYIQFEEGEWRVRTIRASS